MGGTRKGRRSPMAASTPIETPRALTVPSARNGPLRLAAPSETRTVASVLVRAANDADASSPLARGVVHALGHVAFFAPDVGFHVLLGTRGDALAAHELPALCERAIALDAGAADARSVLARVKSLLAAARPAPSQTQ